MGILAVGTKVPDASLHLTGDRMAKLSDFRGKPLVLYFYPKASTPGCTQEGLDFSAAIDPIPAPVVRHPGGLARQPQGTGKLQGQAGLPLRPGRRH